MTYKVKSYDGKTEETINCDTYEIWRGNHKFYTRWQDWLSIWHYTVVGCFPKDKFYVVKK